METNRTQAEHNPYSNDEHRWKIIIARDHQADGTFYHASREQAVQTGLRPCRPNAPSLAARIGHPSTAPAVAGAANPLAVVIPCHRVIRNDGSQSGYCWGVMRKHALLDRLQAMEETPT